MLARGGDGRRPGMVLRVGILAPASKIQKFYHTLPVSGRFATEGHSIQCLSGPEWGERVDVASHIPGPARGVCV
jgi:hypothetical protein